MPDSYLDFAKLVLKTRGRPLTAQQIIDDAERHGIMPTHLSGATMPKTLQARIAEDLFQKREESEFYRTGIGTYFLRELAHDPTLPIHAIAEHEPPPRAKPPPKGRILCVRTTWPSLEVIPRSGVVWLDRHQTYELLANTSSYHHLGFEPLDVVRVTAFVIVVQGSKILSYTVGRHTHFIDLIDQNTIGFRRYVDEFDFDLFDYPMGKGVDLSATREVYYNFRPKRPIRQDLLRKGMIWLGGAFEPQVARLSLVRLIDMGAIHQPALPIRRRLGITKVRWLSLNDLTDYRLDNISRLVLPILENL